MSSAVSRRKSKDQTGTSNGLAAAGRHMTQPLRSTVSASRDSAFVPGVDLVEEWMTESQTDPNVPLEIDSVASETTLQSNETPFADEDAIAKKMRSIDERQRHHRRKKRVALVLVVAVIAAIPALVIALLFVV
ncbi:hypothetical protein CVV68_13285 [Arthrobacter livingstonensis]|uniref:Uncharacterized protein n=1 Tax=Arthrobacter livingstonensis TaxID=670078 RepID=A0A2V5LIA1_9MICC|nr:hypothetical protein [Arthrobacter livingstonensis]PYI66540.1 hypothetical protein CVV68_13285 [Arthrobacter livingstonensis]